MTGLEYLTHLAGELVAAREIRNQSAELFDDLSVEALETAARGLRAISYSAETGARHLGRIAAERRRANEVPPAGGTRSPDPRPTTFEESA